jgi:tRNA dimethylallyltransferase
MASRPNNPPLIAIVGETASGKSELALVLAEQFNGEVIAADSWTVYKEFTIGTAKPNDVERKRVPHHLLDIAEPLEGYSAAEYKRHALAAIADIVSRQKLPILVGGTGLYIDSVLFDYSFLPPSSSDMRSELNNRSIDELLEMIRMAGYDLDGIDIRNKRRLIRLIESNGVRPNRDTELRPNSLIIGLQVPREELRDRVTRRVDAMLASGLEAEVKTLAQKYGWDTEPMKGIGYREFHEYFDGPQTIDETRERIISASMNLAKRQRTWFKRNKSIHWISKQDDAVDLITTFLNK